MVENIASFSLGGWPQTRNGASMSEKEQAVLRGWLVGVVTTIALAVAAWSLQRTVALGEEMATQRQKACDMTQAVSELKTDVKEILRRLPNAP